MRPLRSEPIRSCAGCGRRAPKRELVRFVAREGTLTPGPRLEGQEVPTADGAQVATADEGDTAVEQEVAAAPTGEEGEPAAQ